VRIDVPSVAVAVLTSAFTAAPATAAAQSLPIVTVGAIDFAFDAPASIPAGTVSFRLENAGKEVHHLWLVQLTKSKTFEDFVEAVESSGGPRMPDWAVDVGGPNEASRA
jgi:hypothetical protein